MTRSYYTAATIAGTVRTYDSTSATSVARVATAWAMRPDVSDVRADVITRDEQDRVTTISVRVTTAKDTASALIRAGR